MLGAALVEVEGHEPAPDAPGHPEAHRQLGVPLLQPAVAVDLLVRVVAVRRVDLGVNVAVILTYPCIFCIDNH